MTQSSGIAPCDERSATGLGPSPQSLRDRHRPGTWRVLLTAAVLAVAGCSSQPAATPTDSATVTNSAPSVWSQPDASPRDGGPAGGQDSSGGSASPTLPGLSESCSAVIRAQETVNDLFATAIGTEHTGRPSATATTPTGASSTAATAAPLITATDVTRAFEAIAGTIPSVLTDQFATLRHAAEKATEKPPTAVAEILSESAVADALTDISSYVKACQPDPD